MLREVCEVYYVFPTFQDARRAIYESINDQGKRIIDYLPEELIASRNDHEMKIRLKNGSQIRWVGSNDYNSLRGGGPRFIIFSEYAYQVPQAYTHWAVPILAQNDGVVIFVSTPFQKNHLYDLYNVAINNPKQWYSSYLTIRDTKHISEEEIERRIASGEISRSLAMQEFYCSWTSTEGGFFFSKLVNDMRLQNRIGKIPHEPNHKVHVSADIGWNDSTFLIFFQVIGQVVHIIDCYEKNKEPIAHFAKLINSKDYNYGHFYGPHDLAVHEQQSGTTRLEFWHQLGIDWELVPNVSILDGIEAARCMFSKLYIDEEKCGILIKCLENYQQDYDEKRDYFKDQILKSKYNHGADAFRYMALGLPKTQDSMSAAELQQRYQSVVYGDSRGLPERFSDKFVKRF